MPVLCVGPVCIPLNLLLPFLLGVAHHYGLLKWVKREWVTLQHWRRKLWGGAPPPTPTTAPPSISAAGAGTAAGSQQQQYVCEGGVCRLVPADAVKAGATAAAADSRQAAQLNSSQPSSQPQPADAVRQRHGSTSVQGVKAVDL